MNEPEGKRSPLLDETVMFRVFLIVGAAMALVILVAVAIDPLAGAILLGVEAGVALGMLLRRRGG